MTPFPPGEWSLLLVGDQWPDDHDLLVLDHGKINRQDTSKGFTHFADMLHASQTGPLIGQQGYTADDVRNVFHQGENHARRVSKKNVVKESAYSTSYDSVLSLQHDLTNMAEEGNKQIQAIKDSKEPGETKVSQIVAVINQCRALANMASAKYGANVLDAVQRILDQEGTGQSARQVAGACGFDVSQMFRQFDDHQELSRRVRGMLGNPTSTQVLQGGQLPQVVENAPGGVPPPNPASVEPQALRGGQLPALVQSEASGAPSPGSAHAAPQALRGGQLPPGLIPARAVPVAAQPVLPPPRAPSVGISEPPSVHAGSAPGTPIPSVAGAPVLPAAGAPVAPPTPAEPLTPAPLIQDFDKGIQAGAPFSAPAEVVPSAPVSHSVAPIPQAPPPTTPSASMGALAHAQAFDSPPSVAHTPAPEVPPPVVTGPAGPATPAVATPPAPSGALPAYASDLRPTVQSASAPPAPPSPTPPSATPGSAPVHPSAGQGSTGQPAVVRQSTLPTPPTTASNFASQAAIATATGAVAGAASADAVARTRLQRLVTAVARQQPRLAWAAGDRADNTTVLATDLASGWIPPGIDLPAAVTLLPPARRRGDLENMLGEVSVVAGYTPIHHVSDDDEPVPTSPRPRRAPDIPELGPELSQATQWRDGLPRLAHTLAKAASTGSGVLDSEVELLRRHLAAVSTRVLDSYPDQVDANDVGNWQLLAAIDALVAGDKTAANYHLAWFQAV